MPIAPRLLPCLLAVLCLSHGDVLYLHLLPLLEALTALLAPRWWVHWSLDAPSLELALAVYPRAPGLLPALGLSDGTLQASFPIRHLLLPVAVALATSGVCAARRAACWWWGSLALAATLPFFALIQGLGLVELSLARRAATVGFDYGGSAWLPLMLGMEAGGRWLPCLVVAVGAQARSWRRFQCHQPPPSAPASSPGATQS